MTDKVALAHDDAYCLMAACNPGLGWPVCNKTPPGKESMRGGLAALRGRKLIGFVTKAANPSSETDPCGSGVNPRLPDAFIQGLRNSRGGLGHGRFMRELYGRPWI